MLALYVPRLVYKKRFPKTNSSREPYVLLAVLLWTTSLVAYIAGLEWLGPHLYVLEWLRWGGVAAMFGCIPLSVWTYRTLGAHFSTRLGLLDEHTLVDTGPYALVRHPMYATLFLCAAGASVTSAQPSVLAASIFLVVIMTLRIKKEEAMLAERFGESYLAYMKKTGALVPKLPLLD